ncbi:MAG: histidinol-phosphate transaminase [bacterium]
MNDLKNKITPEYIRSLTPYSPGKPIEELERELGIKNSIKLASNENPIGPSKKALNAIIEALGGINRYPDGGGYYLKLKLSKIHKLDMNNIILGNGSNEIIEVAVRTFLRHGEEAIVAYPSFIVYETIVQASGGRVVRVDLKNFTYDLDSMVKAITPATRLIFIANPNNPTGTIIKNDEFEKFLNLVPENIIIILDEAYYEYVRDKDCHSGTNYLKSNKNLIVIRTFSKIYGLAGLRIGYGLADESLIEDMNKVRQPFNVNSLAQIAALAALDDKEHIKKSFDNNVIGLNYFYREIKKLGLYMVPSQANFLLVNVGNGEGVYKKLLSRGIIVRPMNAYDLKEYIRVTVGLPHENEMFIKALSEIISN